MILKYGEKSWKKHENSSELCTACAEGLHPGSTEINVSLPVVF